VNYFLLYFDKVKQLLLCQIFKLPVWVLYLFEPVDAFEEQDKTGYSRQVKYYSEHGLLILIE